MESSFVLPIPLMLQHIKQEPRNRHSDESSSDSVKVGVKQTDMSYVKRLVFSIIQFLNDQLQSGTLSSDSAESLEVAIQCLETAYGISVSDNSTASELMVTKGLLEIFTNATQSEQNSYSATDHQISDEDKIEADRLKNEGNSLMTQEKYEEALECYTKAIKIDSNNAIYLCNRAASHSKMNKHDAAIEDCKRAITIDPFYSKAYGRMGLAYASLNRHKEAKESYEKAMRLDPSNESYQNNLRIAEEKLRETNLGTQGASAGGGLGLSGIDFTSVLGNPALMNMATQMMSNPQMQQMMASLMTGALNQAEEASEMDALLQAGQHLAQQMQSSNPELVEQLRQQINRPGQQPPQPKEKDDTASEK